MTVPVVFTKDNFQDAWIEASKYLLDNRYEARNLVVHITNPEHELDQNKHLEIVTFSKKHGLLSPKKVAYTIFPHTLYARYPNSAELFYKYNYENGIYKRLKYGRWGTYFRRMTHYDMPNGPVNQVGNIIAAINKRKRLSKAAYTIVIQRPGSETILKMGGPCLNYLAVQIEPDDPRCRMGLLCIYRNHYFVERAYGNYWGLINLLKFIANETGSEPGWLTCVSSHAEIEDHRRDFKRLIRSLDNETT